MTCLTHCKVTSRRHYICWDNMERVLANIVLPPTPPPAHDPQKMLHCHQVQFFKLLLSHGSDLLQIKIRPPYLNSFLSQQEKVKAVSEDVLPIQSWTVPLAYRSLLPLHLSGSDLSWLSQLRFKVFFCFGSNWNILVPYDFCAPTERVKIQERRRGNISSMAAATFTLIWEPTLGSS